MQGLYGGPTLINNVETLSNVPRIVAKGADWFRGFGTEQSPGTKVVWTNQDETPHTVTSNDKSFASKGLDTDDKFEHVFSKEGDFGYICTVHPFMTGVVHVHKQ